ncbi:MAG: DUF4159 domain-containing protein [Planctomycetes bacterium]|jgi:hypothetical protein|nr:DUF4159 domain-containing protein [Phycisphaerae bacterium]NBB94893.1 DUF4159 domain-containing protein [Planctomycetota bacterium]
MKHHTTTLACLVALGIVATFLIPAHADQKKEDVENFTDEDVARAIDEACQWLWSQQDKEGWWKPYRDPHNNFYYPTGPTAIAMYALLESGVTPQDTRMEKALQWLVKSYKKDRMTYSTGLRCMVWYTANRYTQGKFTRFLRDDVTLLMRSTKNGRYSYDCNPAKPFTKGDNSNSQYGLLGVWGGKMAGLEIPRKYWQVVIEQWMDRQLNDGGWHYGGRGKSGTPTMTAAGVASMFVCFDSLYQNAFRKCNVDRQSRQTRSIQAGLDWLDKNFENTLAPRHFFYHMYGIERVGLASGYKYFGDVDWYKVGTAAVLKRQKQNGSFGSVYKTAYAVLYLVRGRRPILFNKLEFPSDWNNRPRDLANLTRWISKTFETPVNWQIITLEAPVAEWHDAPILYLSASQAPNLTDEQIQKIRTFVLQGGTVFSCTECDAASFGRGIRSVYAKMFPEYELTPIGRDHPINDVHFDLRNRVKFHWMTNGVRPLVIHTDEDLPLSWQTNRVSTRDHDFKAAANIYFYCTDKGSLRNRGVELWPSESTIDAPKTSVNIARLKHSGHFDPEPLALERFARLMGEQHDVKVTVPQEAIEIDQLKDVNPDIAWLTGLGTLRFSEAQKTLLRSYVEGGGTLMIDAAGGSPAFAEAAVKLVKDLHGVEATHRLGIDNPIYGLQGMEIGKVGYRRQSARKHPAQAPVLRGKMSTDGRPMVILSEEDITAGLVGYPSYTIEGYAPDSAFNLARNIAMVVAECNSKAEAK